jgi:hypothetical protein
MGGIIIRLTLCILTISIGYNQQLAYPANISDPFMTSSVDDADGNDVFKITVGLSNINSNTELVEVCVNPVFNAKSKVCNIVNATNEFRNDFPNLDDGDCQTCIITVGTFVFPNTHVPEMTKVTVCATDIKTKVNVCGYKFNSKTHMVEDVVIALR